MDFEQGAMSIFEAEGLSHKGPFLLDEKKLYKKVASITLAFVY